MRTPVLTMPWRCVAAAIVVAVVAAGAAAETGQGRPDIPPKPETIESLLDQAADWADTWLVPPLADAVGSIDPAAVRDLLRRIQVDLDSEYVVDLAAMKQAARGAAGLLERSAATQPYAAWLATRLDYFEVADELRIRLQPPPDAPPPREKARPSPALQQQAWTRRLRDRPVPSGAGAYVPELKAAFREHRVPEALVWLAEVESSFNPEARSPAGATGLFQLMPATARSLGLALSPSDERRHPRKSAAAAARYLRHLHGRFDSWPLALAAYNAGEGRVGKLLKARSATSFDAIALHLPAETQMYVPKINATLQRREGLSLSDLPAPH